MSERTKKYGDELDGLIKEGELLLLAMEFECSPKEFREAYLKAFGGDKEKLDSFIKKIPSFGDDYQRWYSEGLCCTNRLMAGVPLSPDRLIPRAL